MKLGIHIPLEFYSASQALHTAKLVDLAELDHVVVNDHLRLPGGPHINEAWTVLAGIAAITDHVRLGPCVSPLPIRHPYLVAKMATTVDQLSAGRLLMGVGAGWHRGEFDWMGVPFRPHAARLAETEEALQLIRSYWTEPLTTFKGRYYQVNRVALEPKPVQHPHPPFFLGGGSLKVLELTAKYGQGWMPFAPTTSGLSRRLKQLSAFLKDQGRTLDELEVMPSIHLQFGKSIQAAQKRLPTWAKAPHRNRAIFGTSDDCLIRIQEYAEAGATHLALRLVHPEESEEAIRTIVQEILPNL